VPNKVSLKEAKLDRRLLDACLASRYCYLVSQDRQPRDYAAWGG